MQAGWPGPWMQQVPIDIGQIAPGGPKSQHHPGLPLGVLLPTLCLLPLKEGMRRLVLVAEVFGRRKWVNPYIKAGMW